MPHELATLLKSHHYACPNTFELDDEQIDAPAENELNTYDRVMIYIQLRIRPAVLGSTQAANRRKSYDGLAAAENHSGGNAILTC